MELEQYLGWRRRQDTRKKVGATTKAAEPFLLSPEMSDLLGMTEDAAMLSTGELEAWQTRLADWLKKPVVHLTFAVPPTVGIKADMVKWFRKEISPDILVRFSINRNIIGGLVVRTTGRIYDFSFRKQFLAHQNLIPEILHRV
ncbi:MAG TPA: F0F1 ATP synthase subunit delta [Candidatus Nanoarchaeia archaeon]|nr:F0F1 ATP synthase subunit delta [Candidatus Nanoarchaeia archaeon]